MFCIHTITASSGKPLLPVVRPPHLRRCRVYVPIRTEGYRLRQTCAAIVPSDVCLENSHRRSRLLSAPRLLPVPFSHLYQEPCQRIMETSGQLGYRNSGCQVLQYPLQYGTHGDKFPFLLKQNNGFDVHRKPVAPA